MTGTNLLILEEYREEHKINARLAVETTSRYAVMTHPIPIRIDPELYEQAKTDALIEQRTIAGQIEYWAKIGRAALDNPDLPVSFIAEALASMAEPRDQSTAFTPRSPKA